MLAAEHGKGGRGAAAVRAVAGRAGGRDAAAALRVARGQGGGRGQRERGERDAGQWYGYHGICAHGLLRVGPVELFLGFLRQLLEVGVLAELELAVGVHAHRGAQVLVAADLLQDEGAEVGVAQHRALGRVRVDRQLVVLPGRLLHEERRPEDHVLEAARPDHALHVLHVLVEVAGLPEPAEPEVAGRGLDRGELVFNAQRAGHEQAPITLLLHGGDDVGRARGEQVEGGRRLRRVGGVHAGADHRDDHFRAGHGGLQRCLVVDVALQDLQVRIPDASHPRDAGRRR